MNKPRILLFDCETAPLLANVWRVFKENIGVNQIREHTTMLSYAARFLGSKETLYEDARDYTSDLPLVRNLCDLLSNTDFVVAHNGRRFDLKQIRGRALVNGIRPFSPVKVIDTLDIAKNEFAFPSNSLAYLAEVLGCSKKGEHKKFPGFSLWAEVLKGNVEAWDEMKLYNIQDIDTLEEVYLKLRPWATQHPNVAVYEDAEAPTCPKCGSTHLQRRGFSHTNVAVYQRFCCAECGGWSRSRYQERGGRKGLLVNAV